MKQTVITVLVICAGGAGMFGMLGARSPAPTAPADVKVVRLNDKLPRVAVSPTVNASKSEPKPLDIARLPAALEPLAPSADFTAAIEALSRRDSLAAIALRDDMAVGSVERLALSWAIAVSGQTAVPVDELLKARADLATWPATDDIEDNLEAALLAQQAPVSVVTAVFAGRQPQTAAGAIVLANARIAAGDQPGALAVIRPFWHSKVMDKSEEDRILADFGLLLTAQDHRLRLKYLLFSERFPQAQRFAALADAQPLYDAFLAVARKDKQAKSLVAKARAVNPTDPVLRYLDIRRLRQASRYVEAATLLADMPRNPADLVDPGKWWTETRIVSRGLLDLGKADQAYRLAAAHVARERRDIVEAEFHAGWFALTGLSDNKQARRHFEKLLATSKGAHDQARGAYWLARSELAAGRPAEAERHFLEAARHRATFYGQLAEVRLGNVDTGSIPRPGATIDASAMARATFSMMPQIRALDLFEQAGAGNRARRLYLALARQIEDPALLQLLAEKALHKDGPSLALAIGKAAQNQGHDPGLAAFPLGAIPDSADIKGAGRALAYAIARQESAFNPTAISPADARGLLQILPSTAKRVAKRHQIAWAEEKLLADPAYNATLGSHYLGEQIDRFGGSYILTFAAYNAGPGRVSDWIKRYGDPRGMEIDRAVDWIERIPFQETRDYVQRVMENYQVYKMLLKQPGNIVADLTLGRRP